MTAVPSRIRSVRPAIAARTTWPAESMNSGAVVLADVEGVDSDRLGQDGLLDGVPDRLVAADRATGLVDGHRQERVETEFERRHASSLPSSSSQIT